MVSKNNYNSRRSSRLNKLFHTKYNLNTQYLTIFINKSYILPYKKWVDEKEFIIFVPYFKSEIIVKDKCFQNKCFQTVKYSVILQSKLYYLQNTHKYKFNDKLQQIEKGNFELVQPIDDRAIRFSILSDIQFNTYYHQKHTFIYHFEQQIINSNCDNYWRKPYCILSKLKIGSNKIMYAENNLSNITLPGTIVSMWKYAKRKKEISLKMCHIIENSLKRRFGDRLSVPCAGVNCYFGQHHSSRLKNRPETIQGDQKSDYYARQNNKFKQNIPIIQKFIELRTKLTQQETSIMNDNYMRFVGYKTCNRLIWTNGMDGSRHQGIPTSNNKQRCFGFINKPHIDKCDLVKQIDSKIGLIKLTLQT